MQQHPIGVAGHDLVKLGPDQRMIVETRAAGEGDPGTGRQQDAGLGVAPGVQEFPAVDQ